MQVIKSQTLYRATFRHELIPFAGEGVPNGRGSGN